MSSSKPYICKYCGTGYTREKTLAVHMCEKKRRHMQKDEKRVQLGYLTFNRFYQLCQKFEGNKTYEEFCDSPYYNAFVKFGSFLNNVRPLYPDKYIDYVVTSGVKLDHWCRDELYEKYALNLILKESVETALERSIKTMMDWSEEKEAPWQHYFSYVSLNRACQDIKDGKVSPWLILNTKSGKEMLAKFSDEQLQLTARYISPEFWNSKFKSYPADLLFVQETAKEAKIE